MGNGEVVLPLAVSVVAGVDMFLDLDGKVVVVPTGGCKVVRVPMGGIAGVAVGGEEVGMPVGGAVSAGGVAVSVGGIIPADGVAGVVVGSGELPSPE